MLLEITDTVSQDPSDPAIYLLFGDDQPEVFLEGGVFPLHDADNSILVRRLVFGGEEIIRARPETGIGVTSKEFYRLEAIFGVPGLSIRESVLLLSKRYSRLTFS